MNALSKYLSICVFVSLSFSTLGADIVKRSSSGICHTRESPWYGSLSNFKAYASIENCIASGGKRINQNALKNPKPKQSTYKREYFPHWRDSDNDCQDSRAEVLIKQSKKQVSFADRKGCFVTRGEWYDPYTDKVYINDDDMDIDHIVSLKWAWEHGAEQWSESKRTAFANDIELNLIAVESRANRSKGAKGPTEWLPENHRYRCEYISRYIKVVWHYGLQFKPKEQRILYNQIDACLGK